MSDKVVNDTQVKRISIKEFREKGFLQEANRQFFHPLGLALEIIIDEETKEEKLGGVWDYREDPEGMGFGLNQENNWNKEEFNRKAKIVEDLRASKEPIRKQLFGAIIEPIPE